MTNIVSRFVYKLAARFAAAGVLLASVAIAPLRGADIELRYGALEKLVAGQLFLQDGRHYVKGTSQARCDFAYLEAPHFSELTGAYGEPRLKITAKFSGRTAMDLFGHCLGLGDSFDLIILTTPVAHGGEIAMDRVEVSTHKDNYYVRHVREALERSFAKDFKIDIREQARKLLEQPADGNGLTHQLNGFDLTQVQVTPSGLVLKVEFKLVVK